MPGSSTSAALNRAVHRYRAAPLGARIFVHGRAFLSDLAFVERFVPRKGFIVESAAGTGSSRAAAEASSSVASWDRSRRPQDRGRARAFGITVLRFEWGTSSRPAAALRAVTIVDVLYLLPFEDQERVLKNAAAALGEGRPLIVKAQERRTDPRYAITYAQELVTVGLGFTRGGHERFYFPSRDEALAMFERAGFVVEVEEMPRRPTPTWCTWRGRLL